MSAEYRFVIFISGLSLFSILEFFFEYRKRTHARKTRWTSNFLLILLGAVLVKMLLPGGLGAVSLYAEESNIGLFNMININHSSLLPLSIIVLDPLIYFQHYCSHKLKFLWRIHRVHHADVDLDATSALRFHPLEIVFSLFYKALIILVFGFSLESIFAFEVILNFMAMFNHSNIGLPRKVERFLRVIFVTPQMHLVHHSVEQNESDTNYGFNLSIWDRVFKTYKDELPEGRTTGQSYYRSLDKHKIIALLTLPFKRNNDA